MKLSGLEGCGARCGSLCCFLASVQEMNSSSKLCISIRGSSCRASRLLFSRACNVSLGSICSQKAAFDFTINHHDYSEESVIRLPMPTKYAVVLLAAVTSHGHWCWSGKIPKAELTKPCYRSSDSWCFSASLFDVPVQQEIHV